MNCPSRRLPYPIYRGATVREHSGSPNLVEVWFGIIDRQAIRRGIFTSVKDLNAKIRQFITGWNDRKHPFVWTKTSDEILAKANRQPTSETRH